MEDNRNVMAQSIPIVESAQSCRPGPAGLPKAVLWLQGITLAWMLVECAVALYAANAAHSVALLAFGADSFVELLSASVALFSFVPSFPFTKERAARWAGILLYLLAVVVVLIAALSLARGVRSETSCSGIGITIAALVVMPVLAWFKRKIGIETGNRVLAADAVQSATCAYLAGITLAGLAANALFHIHWIDSMAAIAAIPILIIEGRKAIRGESCGCH
jgi:divalent metal cation (Fe/Co/Zn/Cd) transporter